MVNKFSLRTGSGGAGAFVGGDGLIRELIFREDLNLCVLTERRVFAPYGLEGADCGQKGRNTLITKEGRAINLGSKSEIKVSPGVNIIFFFSFLFFFDELLSFSFKFLLFFK